MVRFRWSLDISLVLFLFFVLLLPSCMPRMTVKETAHYKLYENILLKAPEDLGTWTKTKIYVPQGAMLAIVSRGEIQDTRDPDKLHWQPYRLLRFKVGENGREMHIESGIDLRNP